MCFLFSICYLASVPHQTPGYDELDLHGAVLFPGAILPVVFGFCEVPVN